MKVKGWPGYVRNGVFVIEKRIKTIKFHASTRCTTLRAAMQQLERFEADPSRYRPEGDGGGDALVLDKPLIEAFHKWHGATATHHWARNVRSLLFDWANHLAGADLRSVSLIDDLKPHLREKPTQKHHRAKAIKLLFKWLRTERGLITRQQDTTLDLVIPTLPPAQRAAPKAVPWELVVSMSRHLPVHVRDVLELLAATGWHIAEVRRFSQTGSIRRRNPSDAEGVVGMLGTVHKNGRKHFTAIMHEQHLAVAERVRERGKVIDNNRLRKHMLRANTRLNAELESAAKESGTEFKRVEPFQLGVMRHSVATWLRQQGISMRDVAEFLGHQSESTTRRHYVDTETATQVLPQRVLRVVT